MPQIVIKPHAELVADYTKVLDTLDTLTEQLYNFIDEVNYGPDLTDEADVFFRQLRNFDTAFQALSFFIPDEVPEIVFTEE